MRKTATPMVCAKLSELVPPMNSNMSGDKYKEMSMTGGGDAEELRTWLQRMCCTLAIPVSSYFGGLRDRVTEVRQRLELPEGRGDRGDRGEFAGSIQDDI